MRLLVRASRPVSGSSRFQASRAEWAQKQFPVISRLPAASLLTPALRIASKITVFAWLSLLFVSRDVRSGESSARLCPEGLFREEWEVLFPHSSPKKQKGEKHTNKEFCKQWRLKDWPLKLGQLGNLDCWEKAKSLSPLQKKTDCLSPLRAGNLGWDWHRLTVSSLISLQAPRRSVNQST